MKPTPGITLPASFVVTVSLAGTEVVPTSPADNDILTVAEVAEFLKCKTYCFTRHIIQRDTPAGTVTEITRGRGYCVPL